MLHSSDDQKLKETSKRKAEEDEDELQVAIIKKMKAEQAEDSTKQPSLATTQLLSSALLELDEDSEGVSECPPHSLSEESATIFSEQSAAGKTEDASRVDDQTEGELLESTEAEEIFFNEVVSDYPPPLINNFPDLEDGTIGEEGEEEAIVATAGQSDQAEPSLTSELGTDGPDVVVYDTATSSDWVHCPDCYHSADTTGPGLCDAET